MHSLHSTSKSDIKKTSKNRKSCIIVNNNISRVLWLNFSKILLLNLSEEDIKQDNIKIIFYSFT